MNDGLNTGLAAWHEAVATRDIASMERLIHPEAILRTPTGHHPYVGQKPMMLVLGAIASLFDNFAYHREFHDPEARSAVLEFSAQLEGRDLKGVDLLRFDQEGRLIELEVMIRPLAQMTRLAEIMGQRAGPGIQGAKRTTPQAAP